MKLSHLLASLGALRALNTTYAFPDMQDIIDEIKTYVRTTPRHALQHSRRFSSRHAHRQNLARRKNGQPDVPGGAEAPDTEADDAEVDDGEVPPVLIGDLANPPKSGLTPMGQTISNILLELESAQDYKNCYAIPGKLDSVKCKADICCKWAYVSQELNVLFKGPSGRCNRYARGAVRLGFHDAAMWEQGLEYGGADGSIILAKEEMKRAENRGLQTIVGLLPPLAKKYGVGMADLIQFAASHAVVVCPLGPRIRVFVGRKDSSRPNKDGLLPSVTDSADQLLSLFQRKTISTHDLVALLGAHTTSTQSFFDPSRPAAPQDGTPGVWDTLFYNQTLGIGPLPKEVLRFPSDIVLANDPRTRSEWVKFGIGREGEGQRHWNEDYAYSYIRMSLLGVNVINQMSECTKVLPKPNTSVRDTAKLLVDS